MKRISLTALILTTLVFILSQRPAAAAPGDFQRFGISNVFDTSFVVWWITAQTEAGQVQLVDGKAYPDDRGEDYVGRVHYVTVGGLAPSGTYRFDVVSGGKQYDNGGTHWTVETGYTREAYQPDWLMGRIEDVDGTPAADVIIFFALDRQRTMPGVDVSAPLSSLVTAKEGIFRVNLRQVRARTDPGLYYAYSHVATIEHDFRTSLFVAVEGARGSGGGEFDSSDIRFRSTNPDDWYAFKLTPTLRPGTTTAQPAVVAESKMLRFGISNVFDTSFVVWWITAQTEAGQVQLVDGKAYPDDRGEDYVGKVHYVTVGGLAPSGTYRFDVVSGGKQYDNGGTHWAVETGYRREPYLPDELMGRIQDADGSPAADVIIFFALDRQRTMPGVDVSAPLSSLVKANDGGVFHANLRLIRARTDPGLYYAYSHVPTIEHDFRTSLIVAVEGALGTGMGEFDSSDIRFRSTNPADWITIQITPTTR